MAFSDEVVYINGVFCLGKEAQVSIYDRGFLMADAVYEVSAVVNGRLIDNEAHLNRLERSLRELDMASPVTREALIELQKQIIEKNNIKHGEVYIQITRGVQPRNFLIDKTIKPTLLLFPLFDDVYTANKHKKAIKVQTFSDLRWQRRDIKTTQLLYQSLLRTLANSNGFDDAWLVDDKGLITEGSANNAWIIKGNNLYTRPANHEILNGITRQTFMRIIKEMGLSYQEKAFTVVEAQKADEAFITSAGNWATPVVKIDDVAIADGKAGKLTCELSERYFSALEELSQ